jgi:hypothetical protein
MQPAFWEKGSAMSEQNEEFPPLPPGAVALLETWLRSEQALRPPPAEAPEVDQLVRYLSGALSADAAHRVEGGLVSSASARRRLDETCDCLDALQTQTWADVAQIANGEDLPARVATAWLALASERVQTAPRARAWWLTQGWEAVRQQVTEGVKEAQAAWTAFTAFGEQWKAGLRRPQFALERGAASGPNIVGDRIPGVEIDVNDAQISATGALYVSVAIRSARSEEMASREGRTVYLALAVNDQTWPVGPGVLENGQARWTVPDLGTALGLPAGRLPADCLRITADAPVSPTTPERLSLLAAIVDAAGQPTSAPPAVIELVSEPRWQGGQFVVVAALPAPTRAAYPDHRLLLDVIIAPNSWQRLGAWPVRDWTDAPKELTAACPGSEETSTGFASLLRALLQAPAAP